MRPRTRSTTAIFFSLSVVICTSICGNVAAQRKRPTPKPNIPNKTRSTPPTREPELQLEPRAVDPEVENADVAITARVKAQSLRFDVVGNPNVEFTGQAANGNGSTVWTAERENLPTPVQPGVTYRNIGIRLKITSVFGDIDRIVAEALGEVPITENAVPKPDAPIKPSEVSAPAPSSPRIASVRSPRRKRR